MAWTVGALVSEAFRELGLADYDYDLDPEEERTGITRLRGLWGTWEALGIRAGFNFSAEADDDSGLPDSAAQATFLNLAIALAPGFGKTLSQDTKNNAEAALRPLQIAAAAPQSVQQPATLPRGAGMRIGRTNRPFFPQPSTDPLQVGPSRDLDIQ